MVSFERAKELLDDPSLSDSEVEQARDEFRLLAEIIFETWREERMKTKEEKSATVQA
jgi:hypothetical protein